MKLKKDIIFWTSLIFFIALAFFFGYKYYYKNYYLPTNTHTVSKFTIVDLKDEEIYYNASKEYIISLLGNKKYTINKVENSDDTNIVEILLCDGYTFYFSNEKLYEFICSSPEFNFKGISIGDDTSKVLETFYTENLEDDNYVYSSDEKIIGKYIYGNFNVYNLDTIKTKEAILYAYETSSNSGDSYIIRYVYMCPPYKNTYASMEDTATYLTFVISNNTVSSISWRVGKAN